MSNIIRTFTHFLTETEVWLHTEQHQFVHGACDDAEVVLQLTSLRHQEGESQGIPLVQQFNSVFEEQSPLRAGQEQSERWTDNQRKKKRLKKKKK